MPPGKPLKRRFAFPPFRRAAMCWLSCRYPHIIHASRCPISYRVPGHWWRQRRNRPSLSPVLSPFSGREDIPAVSPDLVFMAHLSLNKFFRYVVRTSTLSLLLVNMIVCMPFLQGVTLLPLFPECSRLIPNSLFTTGDSENKCLRPEGAPLSITCTSRPIILMQARPGLHGREQQINCGWSRKTYISCAVSSLCLQGGSRTLPCNGESRLLQQISGFKNLFHLV